MRPPICAVCDDDAGEDGGLVSFVRGPSGVEFDRRCQEEEGFVGHPPYVEWFCGSHITAARELDGRTRREAMAVLRQLTEGLLPPG